MGRLALAALLLALLAPPAPAMKYAPIPLGRRITEASVVATGRIATLREDDYTLEVDRWIAGESRRERLRIRRFRDWTCAEREHPYAEGERLLVCVEEGKDGVLEVMGGGGEGEVFLRDGQAVVRHPPHPPLHRPYPEADLIEAVTAYRTLYRKSGEEGDVEAWHRILSHRNPILVSIGVEDLGHSRVRAPDGSDGGAALAGALFGVLEEGPAEDRAVIARLPGQYFGAAAASLLSRFEAMAASGPARSRAAGALACAVLQKEVPARHAALLDALADPSLPLEDRREAAQSAGWYSWPPLRPAIHLEAIAPAAARALRAAGDPQLLRDVMRYLGETWRGDVEENFHDPLPARDRWLERLGFPGGEGIPATAPAEPFRDPYLGEADREVTVPADVPIHERAAVAWVVRTVRRARNAAKAGDEATARREYGFALAAAFGGVEEAAQALGAALDEARAALAK